MNLLCLDLGKFCGCAHIRNGEITDSYTLDFSKHRLRMESEFYAQMRTMIASKRIAAVYHEDAPFQQGMARQYWHTQRGIIALICQQANIPYASVPVTTLKKFMTGKGNASKNDMIAAVGVTRGYYPDDDNEADALAVAMYVIENMMPEVET